MPSQEIQTKQRRLAEFLERHALDGVLLQHRSNFAWITGGRDNHVADNTPDGAAAVLATADARVCLASSIEAPRMRDEELAGTGVETIEFPWHDRDAASLKVIEAVAGRRVAADSDPLGLGLRPLPAEFAELRWSLTNEEVLRYREGAAAAAGAVEQACKSFNFGDSELEIAGLLDYYVRRAGCNPTVTLVAADERIGRFRHPIPTAKRAEHYVMIVCCAEYKGLIACLTRFVAFRPMDEMADRVQALANIDAAVILSTRPGRTLGELFEVLRRGYEAHGFADQWQYHHQGGPTGYANREALATPGSAVTVRENQAFAWNPSLPGAKSEDTILCTAKGVEVLTAPSDGWPRIVGRFEGRALSRADILVR